MKPIWSIAVAIVFLVEPTQVQSQEVARLPITYEKGVMGTAFKSEGKKLKHSDLRSRLSQEPKTRGEVTAARWRGVAANVFGVAGGSLIGWPVGEAIGGNEDPNWTLAFVGAGVGAVGLVFAFNADRHYRNAVDIYNGEMRQGLLPTDSSIQLCMRVDGVTIRFNF